MRRALLIAPALLLLLLGLAAPVAADDEFRMDERLVELGFEEAYTTLLGFGRGVRVHVDYRSLSSSPEEYDEEARRAAEAVWDHLEYRVLAVDVAPTAGVSWRDGDVPPAVSLTSGDLTREFGPRPRGLDEADPFGEPVDLGPVGAVVGWGLLGLLLLGLLVLVVYLVRRRRRPARAPDPWTAGWAGQGWGPAGPWPPGAWAPPHPGWPPPPPAWPPAPPPTVDPRRPS